MFFSCRNCLRREKSPRRSSSATPLSRLARCRCSFGPGRDAVDRPSVVLSSSATTDVSTRPFPGSASHTHTARASTRRGRSFASSRPPPRTAPVARVDTRSRRARSVVPGPGYSRGAFALFFSTIDRRTKVRSPRDPRGDHRGLAAPRPRSDLPRRLRRGPPVPAGPDDVARRRSWTTRGRAASSRVDSRPPLIRSRATKAFASR